MPSLSAFTAGHFRLALGSQNLNIAS